MDKESLGFLFFPECNLNAFICLDTHFAIIYMMLLPTY